MTTRSRRFLMTVWDGGGNAGPELDVARRLTERGHVVDVLGDPTLASTAAAAGCSFSSWSRAPHRMTSDIADDYVRDWEAEDTTDTVRRLRDRVMGGPAAAFAADTTAAIEAGHPDAVLADAALLGAMMAAQAAGIPVAAINPNFWVLPTPGTGDKMVLRYINRVVDGGLPDLNAAREECGLPSLTAFYDQVLGVDKILVLSSEAVDPASAFVPSNVRYVGPVLRDPSWTAPWSSPWPEENDDPLVLVGFSSTFQDQGALLQRVIDALGDMQVRGAVSVGPTLNPGDFAATDNVAVVQTLPHSEILTFASAVVSHCGHGTTMKSLAAGVPLVCIPMGRDQDITADRVVEHRAGVQLPTSASSDEIRDAITTVLHDDEYRMNAARLASVLATEHDPLDAVREVEDLVGLAAEA
jgi:MGT family glycosyltransferase